VTTRRPDRSAVMARAMTNLFDQLRCEPNGEERADREFRRVFPDFTEQELKRAQAIAMELRVADHAYVCARRLTLPDWLTQKQPKATPSAQEDTGFLL
jgi:hypothetical protein